MTHLPFAQPQILYTRITGSENFCIDFINVHERLKSTECLHLRTHQTNLCIAFTWSFDQENQKAQPKINQNAYRECRDFLEANKQVCVRASSRESFFLLKSKPTSMLKMFWFLESMDDRGILYVQYALHAQYSGWWRVRHRRTQQVNKNHCCRNIARRDVFSVHTWYFLCLAICLCDEQSTFAGSNRGVSMYASCCKARHTPYLWLVQ